MSELTPYLKKLLKHQSLSNHDTQAAFKIIIRDEHPEQTAAFLAVLHYRGETTEEALGMLDAIKKGQKQINLPYPTLDIVGTGGDGENTVNISTGSAILTAACGVPILKHGNRAVSSRCGAADILEALGIKVDMRREHILQCINELNIAFLFSPLFHPTLYKIKETRKKLAIPTLFNLLGPLLNPGCAEYRLIGVSSERNLTLMADIVMSLPNIKSTYVFHSCGLDELTTCGIAKGYFIRDGKKIPMSIDPFLLGFKRSELKDLRGGDPFINARLLMEVLEGKSNPIADTLILNAAMALFLYGREAFLLDAVSIARHALQTGKAKILLDQWIAFSKKIGESSYHDT